MAENEEIHIQLLRSVNNLGDVVDSLRKELQAHMAEEEKEDKEIAAKIQAMSDKIDSFAPMKRAFTRTADGEPNYDAHAICQQRRATDEDVNTKRWDKVKDWSGEVIIKGLTYGVIALLLLGGKDWVMQQMGAQVTHVEVKK